MDHATQSSDGRYLEGVLFKWTNVMKGWQPRYFILDTQTATLSYYHSQEEIDVGCKGSYRVSAACQVHVDPSEPTAVELRFPPLQHQPLYLKASTAQERQKWISKLIEIKSRDANTLDITKTLPAQLLLTSPPSAHANISTVANFSDRNHSPSDSRPDVCPPVRTVTLTHAEIEELRSKQKEARFYRQQLKLLLENLNCMRNSDGKPESVTQQNLWHEIEPVSDVLLNTITECLDMLEGKLGNDEKLLSTAASTVVTSAATVSSSNFITNSSLLLPDGVQISSLPKLFVSRAVEQLRTAVPATVAGAAGDPSRPPPSSNLLPAPVATVQRALSEESASDCDDFVDARENRTNSTSGSCAGGGLRSFSTASGGDGSDIEEEGAESETTPTKKKLADISMSADKNKLAFSNESSDSILDDMAHNIPESVAAAPLSSSASGSPATNVKKLHAPVVVNRTFQTIFSRNETTFFDALAPHAESDAVDSGVYTDAFLKSVTPILNMLDILGKRAFYPVKKDLQGNINRLRKHYDDNPSASRTLQNIVEADNGPFHSHRNSDGKVTKPQGSAEAMLWLKRGLQFLERFLNEILLKNDRKSSAAGGDSEDLSKCAQAAYDVTLRQHHNALARGVFHIALKAMPAKSDFLHAVVIAEGSSGKAANTGSAESQQVVISDVRQFRDGLSKALARLQRYFEARGFEEKSMYVLDE